MVSVADARWTTVEKEVVKVKVLIAEAAKLGSQK
jgi:hypothetical protein